MRILITGICGFAGSRIAELLLQKSGSKSCSIVGIDNFSRPGSWWNRKRLLDLGIDVRYGDVRSSSDVFSVGQVDWIIDAAANPSVLGGLEGESASKTLCDNNLLSTIHLLELAKRYQSGFILLSTSRVYSIDAMASLPLIERPDRFELDTAGVLPAGITELGIDESFSTDAPRSLYGATKLASEVMALEYGQAFDFPVWINRCGVLAGRGNLVEPTKGSSLIGFIVGLRKSHCVILDLEAKDCKFAIAFIQRIWSSCCCSRSGTLASESSRERFMFLAGSTRRALWLSFRNGVRIDGVNIPCSSTGVLVPMIFPG